jgi:hypothetical protein
MASPAVADDVVYAASLDGSLYAYAVGCASGGGTCDPLWTGEIGSSTGSSPAVADGVVYVGAGDGTLYAFAVGCAVNGGTCSPLWTGPTNPSRDGITSTPAVANGVVYVGSGDGSLYAFAVDCAENGAACPPIWTAVTPGPILASPAVANGLVYVGSVDMGGGDYGLLAYGVGCATGGGVCTPLWSAPVMDLFSSPAVQDGVLYVGALDGLYALDLGTGPLDHLVLSPSDTTTPAGLNATFTAEGFDQFGHDLGDVTAGSTFQVDGADCTLNNCTSTIAGAHTVTATDGTATGTATLHIVPNTMTSIRIGQSNPGIVAGGSQTFTVEGFDPYQNSYGDVTSSTTFSIDGGGSCTGVVCTSTVAGDHLVTAHNGGLIDSVNLHVGAGPLASIVISPDGATVTAGAGQAFTAEGFDINGNSLGDLTATTTFTIDPVTACPGHVCTPTLAGDHTVTGIAAGRMDATTLHVTPAAATHFLLAGIGSPVVAVVARSVTVTALDRFGNTATAYAGTVHFTSTDSAATLPANSTLTAGGGSFSVTFNTAGTQSVTATDTVTSSITGSQAGITVEDHSGSTYHAIAPARVLDTRPTGGVVVNAGLTGKFIVGTVRTFQVANAHYVGGGSAVAVPAGATAVTGNLTVTGATANGVVALGPTVSPTGDALTIAFAKGETRADSVTIGLGTGGVLQAVYRSTTAGATVQVIFDVTGYFTADVTGATYHPLAPGRILDTRPTSGGVTNIGLAGKFKSKVIRTFSVAGVRGVGWSSALVPAGATAVTGNVTVSNATSDGFVSVGPSMIAVPKTSTVNITPGVNCANGVTVGLNGGKLQAVWVGQDGSSADVIFDVTGYFTADSTGLRYHPLAPVSILDTSTNQGLSGAIVSGAPRNLVVGGAATVPADAAGISGNLTAVNPSARGWAQLAPSISGTPTSSTVNANAHQTIANGFNVALGPSGTLSLIWFGTTGSTTNLQLEVTGYWK